MYIVVLTNRIPGNQTMLFPSLEHSSVCTYMRMCMYVCITQTKPLTRQTNVRYLPGNENYYQTNQHEQDYLYHPVNTCTYTCEVMNPATCSNTSCARMRLEMRFRIIDVQICALREHTIHSYSINYVRTYVNT